jgi:hypothetical protein
MQIDDQSVREDAARGMMALGPSCVSPAPQLKRDWSSSPEFGWIPQIYAIFQRDNLRRHF